MTLQKKSQESLIAVRYLGAFHDRATGAKRSGMLGIYQSRYSDVTALAGLTSLRWPERGRPLPKPTFGRR